MSDLLPQTNEALDDSKHIPLFQDIEQLKAHYPSEFSDVPEAKIPDKALEMNGLTKPRKSIAEVISNLQLFQIIYPQIKSYIDEGSFPDGTIKQLNDFATQHKDYSDMVRKFTTAGVDATDIANLLGYGHNYIISEIEPLLNTPDSIVFSTGRIIQHDLNNLMKDAFSAFEMALTRDTFEYRDENDTIIQKESYGYYDAIEIINETQGFPLSENLQKAENLLTIVARAYETEKTGKKFVATPRELIDTMLPFDHDEVMFADNTEFRSLEEFMAARTLLHNSIKAAQKEKEDINDDFKGEIRISMDVTPLGRSLIIMDNIPDRELSDKSPQIAAKWLDSRISKIKNAYRKGAQDVNWPYPEPKGGLYLVAYPAGQRSVEMETDTFNMGEEGNYKYVELLFPNLETKSQEA